MRVTTQMIVGRTARRMARQRESINRLSTMTSTGKIVNQPSDDPATSSKILNDRSTISRYGQYKSNISQAQTWIEAGLGTLETVYDLLDQARDVVVDQSSGDLDTREAMIMTLEGLYDQIVDLANTRFGGEYLYSGDADDVRPFANETTVTGGVAEDIVFDLAEAAADVEIEILDGSGAVVRTLTVAGGSLGTNTVTWDGLDDLGNPVADGVYTYSVSATDAAGDPVAAYHTYRGSDGDKETIVSAGRVVQMNQDGGDIFSEALRGISQALAALETIPYDPSDLTPSIGDLGSIMDDLQHEMVTLSVINARVDMDLEHLTKTIQTFNNKLSEEESCDADQAAVELQSVETAYEVTMETAALILNMPNLMSLL